MSPRGKRANRPPKPQAAPGPGQAAVLLLCSEEPSLRRAWERASAPAGLRLESAPKATAERIASAEALLVVVDAK
ncbi:MAG: hypothetical protein WBE00_06610, partial [Phycisphaerae bacterium]